MQQSRRNPINAHRLSTLALREATNPCGVDCDAKVTVLGDYISRHLREVADDAFPGTRKGTGYVLSIGHDLRDSPSSPKQNGLLAALDAQSYLLLRPQLEFVSLPQGWALCEACVDLKYVYFPISGIVSVLYELENGTAVEVALTGNEGLVGVQAFMGGGTATSRAVVRSTGYGYRLRADALQEKFEHCPLLRHSLLRYAQVLMAQVTQTAVCQCHHPVEQQVSRLLLSSLDRLPSDELDLTQEAMANLLGVRRESITEASGKLQRAGLIRYHRGRITVLNRPELEARVCECYAVVRAELDRLVPQQGAGVRPSLSISRRLAEGAGYSASAPSRL
jgi:CRP-like cAMP-binding protein